MVQPVAFYEFRYLVGASLFGAPAPGAESASARRRIRPWQLSLQDDALALATLGRIRLRNCRQKRLCVRVRRVGVDVLAFTGLDDLAQVHDRHTVADLPDDGQIVRDQDVRDGKFALESFKQVHDLGLDRYVQRRQWLIKNEQRWFERQRAGYRDTLPLAAGELVRESFRVLGLEPDELQQLIDRERRPVAGKPWTFSGSAMMARTVSRGSREEYGS